MTEIHIDKIIYSKRRTLALQINSDGLVIVRAPKNIPLKAIELFVGKHRRWIHNNKARMIEFKKSNRPRIFAEGEFFYYLGEAYRLNILDDPGAIFRFDNNFCLPRIDIPRARPLFIWWYANRAKEIIADRVKYYSSLTGLHGNRLTITGAYARWGSCSNKGNLCFSWRLVMAPLDIIDYVIVHELAHLEIKNHSKNFWKKVESIMPDYKIRRQWLRKNGTKFNL